MYTNLVLLHQIGVTVLLLASFPFPQNKDARNHPHFMYDATRLRYVVFYLRLGVFVRCVWAVGYSERVCCVRMVLSVGVKFYMHVTILVAKINVDFKQSKVIEGRERDRCDRCIQYRHPSPPIPISRNGHTHPPRPLQICLWAQWCGYATKKSRAVVADVSRSNFRRHLPEHLSPSLVHRRASHTGC